MSRKKPERMCIGCRKIKEKSQLLRICLQKDGMPVFDPQSERQGRGAYICKESSCICEARKNHGLARSFRRRIPEETADRLFEEMEKYIEQ